MTKSQLFVLRDQFALDDAAKVKQLQGSGYLAAMPRVARTGIQLYRGSEVGMPTMDIVRVYRPADAVFNAKALESMTHKPVTDDHPPVLVDAKNWRKYSRGTTGDETLRDGEFVRVPMMVQDADLIDKMNKGKVEISVGYTCGITFQDGKTEDGEPFDAVQSDITVNHVAFVDQARGGAKLRIGDGTGVPVDKSTFADALRAAAAGKVNSTDAFPADAAKATSLALGDQSPNYCIMSDGVVFTRGLEAAHVIASTAKDGDMLAAINAVQAFIAGDKGTDDPAPARIQQKDESTMTKTVIVDGLPVTVSDDRDGAILSRFMDGFEAFKKKTAAEEEAAAKKVKDATDLVVARDAAIVAKDAEITDLKAKLAAATITPAMMDAAVAERTAVISKAKVLAKDVDTSKMATSDIKAAVVTKVMGDKAKNYTADHFAIAFDTLTVGVKDGQASASAELVDSFQHVGDQGDYAMTDADKAYEAGIKTMQDAWKFPNGRPQAN